MTCLIIDDNPIARTTLNHLASQVAGLNVIRECSSAIEAFNHLQADSVDLLFLDIEMPGMNGLDATQRIREYQALRHTPIVAVSAYGANEYRSLAIEAGCNEYVSTPFDPSALAELIESLIAKRESFGVNDQRADLEH